MGEHFGAISFASLVDWLTSWQPNIKIALAKAIAPISVRFREFGDGAHISCAPYSPSSNALASSGSMIGTPSRIG